MRKDDWKLICPGKVFRHEKPANNSNDPKPGKAAARRCELYHLQDDSGELRDVSGAQPEVFGDLESTLSGWLASHELFLAPASQQKLSPEQEMKLRSLGYTR